jgi:hypothetical protein
MVKRIMVTLDDDQYRILQGLKGFGSKDAEIIRNIVVAYLSEKSYLKRAVERGEAETTAQREEREQRKALIRREAPPSSVPSRERSYV